MAMLRRGTLTLLIDVVLCTAGWAADATRVVVPVDGPRFPGELAAADAAWNLTFRAGKDAPDRKLNAADLVVWGAPADPANRTKLEDHFPPAEVLLTDGGLVVCDLKESKGAAFVVTSDTFGSADLPRSAVRGLLFAPPIDRSRRDSLAQRLLALDGKTDHLLLLNGDIVPGRVQEFVQTTGGDGKRQFLVEHAVGTSAVKVTADRIAGVSFATRGDDRDDSSLRAIVGFRDGTRLIARRLEVAGDQAVVESLGGQTWKAPRSELACVQPLGDNVVYLSDRLAPTAWDESGGKGTPVGRGPREKSATYKYVPLLTAAWPYYADRNVRGAHLRSAGQLWLKGIGMHSGGALTVALPGEFRRLEAELALDDSVGTRGSVIFEVRVFGRQEGKVSLLRNFTSEVVRGGAAPTPLSVDLTDAIGVSLSVLFAEQGDELDHANWLHARLVK